MGTPAPSFNKYESIGGPADSGLPAVDGSAGDVVTPVPINPNLTFGQSVRMPLYGYQNQAGALNIVCSAIGAVDDCSVDIYLIADGNPITVTGADVYGDGPKTTQGLKQVLSFQYSAGVITCFVGYYGSVTTIPGDTTKPTMNARSVANGTPSVINVAFTEAMDQTSVPLASTLTVSGHTVSTFAFVDSTHANITVTSPFVNGEAARTLAYNGSALKDLAGNVLDAFSNAAIVNNVAPVGDTTPPTITARSVENGSPSVLNMTFSEAMDTTASPPVSAFTLGGHTINTFAWVDSTHANLALGSPFVNGEAARTLAYAVPGSNPLKDAAGNQLQAVSGSVVNNVTPVTNPTVSDSFTRADNDISAGPLWTAMNGAVFGISGNQAVMKSFKTTGPRGGIWTECGSANGTLDMDVVNDQYTQGTGPLLRRVDDNTFMWLVLGGDRLILFVTSSGLKWTVKSLVGGSYPYTQTTHVKVVMTAAVNPTDPILTISATGGADMVITKADFASAYDDGASVQGAPTLTTGTKHGMWDNPGMFDNFNFVPA